MGSLYLFIYKVPTTKDLPLLVLPALRKYIKFLKKDSGLTNNITPFMLTHHQYQHWSSQQHGMTAPAVAAVAGQRRAVEGETFGEEEKV